MSITQNFTNQSNPAMPLNIVAVSGGLNTPSKTESLVQNIVDELAQATPINVHFIKLSEIGPLLSGAIYRNQLPERVQNDLAAIEAADALIVGTPVYRASFTGLFKHLFDFVEQTALVDVPVLLAASGELVGAIAMTEPGTGSDLQAIKTYAVKDGDDYILNGSKTFITNGQLANLIIVACKTDREKGAQGVSLLVLETDGLAGFERGRNLEKIGLSSQDTSELFFNNVRVPQKNLLGSVEGMGFIQLMQELPQERLIIALAAAGAIKKSIELTIEYTKERHAFNKPVWSFQNTRFKLAECNADYLAVRAMCDAALEAHLNKKLTVQHAALLKAFTTDKQAKVTDECLQLFGGYGYMLEYPIARLYADARVQKIYGGTNEIMKELASRFM
jgi:alkylation response protein AidB-like acyl-CoA dehydrogenase